MFSFALTVAAVYDRRINYCATCSAATDCRYRSGSTRPWFDALLLSKRMNDKTNDRDTNTRIGDIERRPWMRVGKVEIEKKKIDDVSVKKAISKVSQDTSEQERQRNIAPNVPGPPPDEKRRDKEKRETGNYDEKRVVVLERAESCTRVRDVDQIEETGNDHVRLIRFDEPKHIRFGELIERVERQGKEENEFHVDPTLFVTRATTLSHRSHKSGCAALAPTAGR
jgi:hypothetical protein